jgi:hypothetical protein
MIVNKITLDRINSTVNVGANFVQNNMFNHQGKHIHTSHPLNFEESLVKYYDLAKSTGDPKILKVLNVLKDEFLGLNVLILLNQNLSVIKFFLNFEIISIKFLIFKIHFL